MSKSITIVAKEGEGKKEEASATLIGIISLVLILAVAAVIGYFLLPVLWSIVKFVVLIWNFFIALFFALGLSLIKKGVNKKDVERGFTNRDVIHERRKAKSVGDSSEEEKAETIEKDKEMNGLFILLSMSLWLAPLFFGMSKQYQFVPANYIAPFATLLGFITWVMLSGNTIKIYDVLDEKVELGKGKNYLLYKTTALFILIHLALVAGYTVQFK